MLERGVFADPFSLCDEYRPVSDVTRAVIVPFPESG